MQIERKKTKIKKVKEVQNNNNKKQALNIRDRSHLVDHRKYRKQHNFRFYSKICLH